MKLANNIPTHSVYPRADWAVQSAGRQQAHCWSRADVSWC